MTLCCGTIRRARLAIQEAFGPSMKVVSSPAREILLGGGDIHCMSMQVTGASYRLHEALLCARLRHAEGASDCACVAAQEAAGVPAKL